MRHTKKRREQGPATHRPFFVLDDLEPNYEASWRTLTFWKRLSRIAEEDMRETILRSIVGLPSVITYRRSGYRVFRPIRVRCFGHGGSWKELYCALVGPC